MSRPGTGSSEEDSMRTPETFPSLRSRKTHQHNLWKVSGRFFFFSRSTKGLNPGSKKARLSQPPQLQSATPRNLPGPRRFPKPETPGALRCETNMPGLGARSQWLLWGVGFRIYAVGFRMAFAKSRGQLQDLPGGGLHLPFGQLRPGDQTQSQYPP